MRDVGTLAVEGVLAEWEDRTRLSGDLAKKVEEETRGGAEVNDRDGCTEYSVRSSDDGLPWIALDGGFGGRNQEARFGVWRTA